MWIEEREGLGKGKGETSHNGKPGLELGGEVE